MKEKQLMLNRLAVQPYRNVVCAECVWIQDKQLGAQSL